MLVEKVELEITVKMENGQDLISICQSYAMVQLNHLEHHNLKYQGGLTYKQGETWISQLNWVLCSKSVVSNVDKFSILCENMLLTDHAALSLKLSGFSADIRNLVHRSESLGLTFCETEDRKPVSRRPVPIYPNKQCSFHR